MSAAPELATVAPARDYRREVLLRSLASATTEAAARRQELALVADETQRRAGRHELAELLTALAAYEAAIERAQTLQDRLRRLHPRPARDGAEPIRARAAPGTARPRGSSVGR